MTEQNERLLANFARSAPDYPLLIVGAGVLFLLLTGLVAALSAASAGFSVLFLLAFVGAAAFFWLANAGRRRSRIGERNRQLTWDIDLPTNQQIKLNTEVIGLAKVLDISQEQLSDLLSAYIVAEDLALRQIQQEAKVPVLRHVLLGDTPFDGVLLRQDLIICIEVTFLVAPHVSQEKISQYLNKVEAAKRTLQRSKFGGRLRLLFVLVTQLDDQGAAQLRSTIVKNFEATPVDVDIRLLDFASLQKTYAMD